MSQNCQIQLLGKFRILVNGTERTLKRAEARRILAYLAFRQGRHCRRSALIELLDRRDETEGADARRHLSVRICDIRQLLAECGTRGREVLRFDDEADSYSLGEAGWTTDVREFRKALELGAAAPTADRVGALRKAAGHYQGPLLPDWDDLWITPERMALAREYGRALHQLILRLWEADDVEAAQHFTRRLLEHAPHDARGVQERAEVLLLTGAAEADDGGERTSSLRPSSGAQVPSPSTELVHRQQSSLPVWFDTFVGREAETGVLLALMRNPAPRMVSIVGPPGAGKTRLAIQAAHRLTSEEYPGGRYFVDLRPIRDPLLIVPRLFRSAGFHYLGGIPSVTAMAAEIGSAPILVVLDNWEQLAGGGDPVLLELLQAIPSLKLVVTSRRRPMIPGEHLFELGPLRLPPPDADADGVRRSAAGALFVDRARQAEGEFILTPESSRQVAALCRRLDGIPLALELMARDVRGRGLSRVLEELEARYADAPSGSEPLQGLTALHSALETSYSLLTSARRSTFSRSSVFRGGWDVPAARAILNREEIEEDLGILRDHSLLTFTIENSTARYGLLEVVREFAENRLSDEDRQIFEAQHACYFFEMAREATAVSSTRDQVYWLDRLDLDIDNLRAALDVLSRSHREDALRLAGALAPFWATRGYIEEARSRLGPLLETALEPSVGTATAMLGAAIIERRTGNRELCLTYYQRALGLAGAVGPEATRIAADAHMGIGWCRHLSNQPDEALEHMQAAEQLCRTIDYTRGSANCLVGLGLVLRRRQQSELAREKIEAGIAILRDLGDLRAVSAALRALGPTAYYLGDLPASRAASEEAARLAEELGDWNSYASALHNLAGAVEALGDPETARKHLLDALAILRRLRERHVVLEVIEDLANLAAREGQTTLAIWLWAGAEGERKQLGTPLAGERAREFAIIREAVRSQLGASAYEFAWESGGLMPWEELMDLAVSRLTPVRSTPNRQVDRDRSTAAPQAPRTW